MTTNAGAIPPARIAESEEIGTAALLAWVGGFTDAAGYVLLAHLFTAHMSGSTIAAGEALGSGAWAEAARRAFPLPWFVVGIIAGRVLTENSGADETARPTFANAMLLIIEAVALAGAVGVGVAAPYFGAAGQGVGWADLLGGALLSFAMGIQNMALRRPGGAAMRTTYVTGTLNQFVEEVVRLLLFRFRHRGESGLSETRRNALLHGGIYAGYLAGAIAFGLVATLLRPSPWWALVLPLIVLVGLVARARNVQHTSERRS